MAIDKQSITQLLESRHISQVIYVDDSFSPSSYEPGFIAYIRSNCGKEHNEWPFEDNGVAEVTIGAFKAWWDKLEKKEKVAQIQKFGITRTESNIEICLHDCFDSEKLRFLDPDDFDEEIVRKKADLTQDNQLLILMDYNLQEWGKGIELLHPFANCSYVACGIFSETISIESELEKWETWCDFSAYIYPISKNRLTDEDGNHFIQGLRNVMWLKQISDIKDTYYDMIVESSKNLQSLLKKIDPASFDRVVIEESKNEGCWEFETLHRVGEAILNKKIDEQLVSEKYGQFQNQTFVLRKIKESCGQQLPKTTLLANKIIEYEKYSNAEFLNKTYSPIGNGDIYRIKGKLYILLCQPCNLEIRDDGVRTAGEMLYLLPMLSNGEETQYATKLSFQSHEYLIRYATAQLNVADIIDLVSFNPTGEAKFYIQEDAIDNVLIRPNMIRRYNRIRSNLLSYYQKLQLISNQTIKDILGPEFNAVKKCFANPKWKGKFIPTPSITNEVVDFGITRVARLKDPYAQELLQEFMSYLCRPANPMKLQ